MRYYPCVKKILASIPFKIELDKLTVTHRLILNSGTKFMRDIAELLSVTK